MQTTTDRPARLRCPKCAGDLVTFERQGIHVEQCTDCRGIWLDRGELDRLIDVESRYEADPRRGDRPDGRRAEPGRDAFPGERESLPFGRSDDRRDRDPRAGRGDERWDRDDDDDRAGWYGGDDRRRGDARPGRKRSLFGELFEGFME